MMVDWNDTQGLVAPSSFEDWTDFARESARKYGLKGSCIIQTEGPSPENPARNHKMEIIDLRELGPRA